jgi:hypothetical protein
MPYDIGYNNGPLAILCHVVYTTLGLSDLSNGCQTNLFKLSVLMPLIETIFQNDAWNRYNQYPGSTSTTERRECMWWLVSFDFP